MTLGTFLKALFDQGRVSVGRWGGEAEPDGPAEANATLAEFERAWRLDFSGEPPAYDPAAARWAATVFYRACQMAVFRDVDAKTGLAALKLPGPSGANPAAHYAVDLVFRFLPDLARLAKSAAEHDPLLIAVRQWAWEWPLSSVGMKGLGNDECRTAERVGAFVGGNPAMEAIVAHRGLLSLYVDRIIACADVTRLSEPRVREAVKAAIGAHPELAPAVAAALSEHAQSEAGPGVVNR